MHLAHLACFLKRRRARKMINKDDTTKAKFQTDIDSRFIDRRRANVKSDLIEITEDKLENILLKHLQQLGRRKLWITPCSLFITLMLANLSATFENKFGIEGAVWDALFILMAVISGIWLIVSLVCMFCYWKNASLANLIAKIKNAEDDKIEKESYLITIGDASHSEHKITMS